MIGLRLKVCTLLWDSNEKSEVFSQMYDETWVEKLYRGFRRNLTHDFDFICFTDRPRTSWLPIEYRVVDGLGKNGYSDCIVPYSLNEPMILCGLDTVVLDDIDHIADYVLMGTDFALPKDPYVPERACNGVALVPAGMKFIYDDHDGENDMVHVRKYFTKFTDDVFPGQIVSYKGHVKKYGWNGVKIVFFHGQEKPHQLWDATIQKNWV